MRNPPGGMRAGEGRGVPSGTVTGNPLGARGVTAEAAIARLCLRGLPALELFERAAVPFRRAVPYTTAAWKPVDPQTMLWTGFGLENWGTGTAPAARWRFVDNELLDRDFAKYSDLARRRVPVSTLHRETHGEPDRSPRYRNLHRSMGFGAELRSVFRAGETCWGIVTLVRAEDQGDFSDQEVAFAARISDHLGHGLRGALLREVAATGPADRAPGVIVLGEDGTVRSLTDQAQFWLEQFPSDRGTGLQLPAAVHAVAQRALAPDRPGLAVPPYASVRLVSGQWLTLHAAPLLAGGTDPGTVAVTLAPAGAAELEPLRLALYDLTPREREIARLLTRGVTNDEIAKALWISRYTVKDHAKAVYAKLGIRGRAELSAKLFYEHIAPRIGSQQVRAFGLAGPAS